MRLNGYIVQVCHNSKWGFVCSNRRSWNFYAVHVVCKQVGMPSSGQYCTCTLHCAGCHGGDIARVLHRSSLATTQCVIC